MGQHEHRSNKKEISHDEGLQARGNLLLLQECMTKEPRIDGRAGQLEEQQAGKLRYYAIIKSRPTTVRNKCSPQKIAENCYGCSETIETERYENRRIFS